MIRSIYILALLAGSVYAEDICSLDQIRQIDTFQCYQPVSTKQTVKVVRVLDGDTLELESGHRVRLIGVDTPEIKSTRRAHSQYKGDEAKKFSIARVEGKTVQIEFDPRFAKRCNRDEYNRFLAYVYTDDGMLNLEILRKGLAKYVKQYPFDKSRMIQFANAEKQARSAKLGVWKR